MPQFLNSAKSSLQLWLIITAGAAIAVVIFAHRSTFGLFVDPVISECGWGRDLFALAMGIQQLTWGVLQSAAAASGLLWLSTVPLTSGLVAIVFGTKHLGVLFGLGCLAHQLGTFFGIWLGGYVYEIQASYLSVWIIALSVALVAALIHLPNEECSTRHDNAQQAA